MQTPGFETIIALLVVVGAVCAFGGYAFAQARARRAGGGKTAAQLKVELGDYKENVTEHFQTTANLLHDMTEQYRSIYEHMAAGAQTLCDTERATAQIESLQAGLLPGRAKPSTAPGSEQPSGDIVAQPRAGAPSEPGRGEGVNPAREADDRRGGVSNAGVKADPVPANPRTGA
jgi:uncharacterized membrane-anchored protein YhcB (DUF1043 family)